MGAIGKLEPIWKITLCHLSTLHSSNPLPPLEMGGSQEWEVGFIIGGWEIFEALLHSWQRGANPLIL